MKRAKEVSPLSSPIFATSFTRKSKVNRLVLPGPLLFHLLLTPNHTTLFFPFYTIDLSRPVNAGRAEAEKSSPHNDETLFFPHPLLDSLALSTPSLPRSLLVYNLPTVSYICCGVKNARRSIFARPLVPPSPQLPPPHGYELPGQNQKDFRFLPRPSLSPFLIFACPVVLPSFPRCWPGECRT